MRRIIVIVFIIKVLKVVQRRCCCCYWGDAAAAAVVAMPPHTNRAGGVILLFCSNAKAKKNNKMKIINYEWCDSLKLFCIYSIILLQVTGFLTDQVRWFCALFCKFYCLTPCRRVVVVAHFIAPVSCNLKGIFNWNFHMRKDILKVFMTFTVKDSKLYTRSGEY